MTAVNLFATILGYITLTTCLLFVVALVVGETVRRHHNRQHRRRPVNVTRLPTRDMPHQREVWRARGW